MQFILIQSPDFYYSTLLQHAERLKACCSWLQLLSYDWTITVQGRGLSGSQFIKGSWI